MRPLIIAAIFCFTSLAAYSQPIRFSSLSFREALAKAKREGKPLFIEIYTTWCTYCKQMERDVFTTKEAGDYYNGHFISLRYDAVKTDGIQIRNTYTLPGLPAFLYLSPDGLVLRKTAGFQPLPAFLANAGSAVILYSGKDTLRALNP